MVKKGFLKGYAGIFNFILRLIDLSIVLVCGALSYNYSTAADLYAAVGVQGLPDHYFKVIFNE